MVPLAELSQEEIDQIVESVPGGQSNIQDIYALSLLQESIFFHHLSLQDDDPYVSRVLLGLPNRALVEQLVAALNYSIARHDALHTAVKWNKLRSPVQVVLGEAVLQSNEIDFQIENGDIATQLQEFCLQERYHFDVREAPLLRLFTAQDKCNDRWIVLILEHHLALDHISLALLVDEVKAKLLGKPIYQPAPVAYRNHIGHLQLKAKDQEHGSFFDRLLADVDNSTLPYELSEIRGSQNLGEATLLLENNLSQALRDTARAYRVSPASLFHLAYGQMVGRLSNQENVVFGTVLLGRSAGWEGVERVVGMLMNTLPLYVSIGKLSVEAALRQTHKTLTDLVGHEQTDLGLIQRTSKVTPLFSALFNYRHRADETGISVMDSLPLGIEVLKIQERTNYPFSMSVDDWSTGFLLTAQVRDGIDPTRVCGYLMQTLKEVVNALRERPHTSMLSLPFLSAEERDQLLTKYNKTDHTYSASSRIESLSKNKPRARRTDMRFNSAISTSLTTN